MKNPYSPPDGYIFKTIPEAAITLGLAESTVKKYIKEGTLASVKFGGTRRVLFAKSSYENQKMKEEYDHVLRLKEAI